MRGENDTDAGNPAADESPPPPQMHADFCCAPPRAASSTAAAAAAACVFERTPAIGCRIGLVAAGNRPVPVAVAKPCATVVVAGGAGSDCFRDKLTALLLRDRSASSALAAAPRSRRNRNAFA